MNHKTSILSLVVVWLLLFPFLFLTARGGLSFERTADNNTVVYSAGTLIAAGADSTYRRLEQACVYGLIILAMSPTLLGSCRSHSWRGYTLIALLPTWAMLSSIWSQDAPRTAGFAVSIAILTYFGIFIAKRFNAEQQIDLVMFIGWCVLLGSYSLAILYPAAGIAQFDGKGAWQGIFTHKNHCAFAMALFLTAALFRRIGTPIQEFGRAIFVIASCCLIILTQSRTGWILLGSILLYRLFATVVTKTVQRERIILLVVGLLIAALGALFVTYNFSKLAILLGKSSNLTGRTQIWSAILPVLWKRPFLGFGYQAFWIGMKGESANLELATGYIGLANAENAVLQIWLEIGVVGVALMFLTLWNASRHAIKCIVSNPSRTVMWHSAVVFLAFLALVDGDKIMFPHTIQWVLFVVASVGLSDSADRARRSIRDCHTWPTHLKQPNQRLDAPWIQIPR